MHDEFYSLTKKTETAVTKLQTFGWIFNHVSRVIRDGPLENLQGGGGSWGIFEPQEFFCYHIPCMNFFRPWHDYFLGLIGTHEFFFI